MHKILAYSAFTLIIGVGLLITQSEGFERYPYMYNSMPRGMGYNGGPWNGPYYHVQYGQPLALVVPPTCRLQTDYSWGVPSMRVCPIGHQFSPTYPGPSTESGWLPPPYWPSDTNQFGVYYVRGPW